MALTGGGLNSMRSIPTFGTVGAIAEIVDNSIQWKTKKDVEINIVFIQRNNSLDEVIISDNGQGMGKDSLGREIIEYCLLFGGGTNHGATSDLGKFGIGLPYACCSQSEEYHVYSWQEDGEIKHKWRNHDDFELDEMVNDKPFETQKKFPKYFDKYIPNLKNYKSGTIVQWKNCDNLTYKTAKTLIKHIEKKLGRTYRHFIDNGVTIEFRCYNQPSGSSPVKMEDLSPLSVKKFDPLFLDTGTLLPAPYDTVPPSEPWGKPKIEEFIDSDGLRHEFKITASLAKKEIQLPNCKKGGQSGVGKNYYPLVTGISLVRAKRELRIHHFNFRFPNNRADQRHRFWKIEVQFEPISDSLLGVNANKTDAQHFRFITDEDQEDQNIDYIKLRYQLASVIQNLIENIWDEMMDRVQKCKDTNNPKAQICPKCKLKTLVNGKCTSDDCDCMVDLCAHGFPFGDKGCIACNTIVEPSICTVHKVILEDGKCPICQDTIPLSEDEIEELILILEGYREFTGERESIKSLITWFVKSRKKHFLIFVSNPTNPSQFFEIKTIPDKFEIILVNRNHPYYLSHIGPLREMVDSGIDFEDYGLSYDLDMTLESVVLFIITWAITEKQSTSDQKVVQRFRSRFGIELNEVLDVWNYTDNGL